MDRHNSAQYDASKMRLCVSLITLIQDSYYSSEYLDFYKEKNWFEDIEDKPEYSTWNSKILNEEFNTYFEKYPLIYKRVINGEGVFSIKDNSNSKMDIKQRIAMNIGRINHDRSKRLLFKILEKNIESWWD
jgi:hypothetical protein